MAAVAGQSIVELLAQQIGGAAFGGLDADQGHLTGQAAGRIERRKTAAGQTGQQRQAQKGAKDATPVHQPTTMLTIRSFTTITLRTVRPSR